MLSQPRSSARRRSTPGCGPRRVARPLPGAPSENTRRAPGSVASGGRASAALVHASRPVIVRAGDGDLAVPELNSSRARRCRPDELFLTGQSAVRGETQQHIVIWRENGELGEGERRGFGTGRGRRASDRPAVFRTDKNKRRGETGGLMAPRPGLARGSRPNSRSSPCTSGAVDLVRGIPASRTLHPSVLALESRALENARLELGSVKMRADDVPRWRCALACAGSRARTRALGLDGWYAHDRRVDPRGGRAR